MLMIDVEKDKNDDELSLFVGIGPQVANQLAAMLMLMLLMLMLMRIRMMWSCQYV